MIRKILGVLEEIGIELLPWILVGIAIWALLLFINVRY